MAEPRFQSDWRSLRLWIRILGSPALDAEVYEGQQLEKTSKGVQICSASSPIRDRGSPNHFISGRTCTTRNSANSEGPGVCTPGPREGLVGGSVRGSIAAIRYVAGKYSEDDIVSLYSVASGSVRRAGRSLRRELLETEQALAKGVAEDGYHPLFLTRLRRTTT